MRTIVRMHIFSGKFKKRSLLTPQKAPMRPSTGRLREALFNVCQQIIEEARFLDLFAGSGAVGLEALSRGAKHCTFVEMHKECLACLRKNIARCGVQEQTIVYPTDVSTFVQKRSRTQGSQYDIIFADPPYTLNMQEVLEEIALSPLFSPKSHLFLEMGKESPLDLDSLPQLQLEKKYPFGRSTLLHFTNASST